MEPNKSSARAWFILGLVFIALLFLYAYLSRFILVLNSAPLSGVASAVFGAGGIIFLIIGAVKGAASWFRK